LVSFRSGGGPHAARFIYGFDHRLMRAAPLLSLLIPAALGAGAGELLIASHKPRAPPAKPAPAIRRHLKLEAYDPQAPEAPPGQKLETTTPHAQLAETAPAPEAVEPPPAPEVMDPPPSAPPPSARPSRPPSPAERQASEVPPRPVRVRPPPYLQPRAYANVEPRYGRYVDSRQAGEDAPDDPRGDAAPEPSGFRITVKMCRQAVRHGDPLAETEQCQGMLQAARVQERMCARAFAEGDDQVALSPACRQAAMAR
jgi:hypothetical protein